MRKALIYFFVLNFISCSPKLRSSIIKKNPELPTNELVVVLDIIDEQVITEEKVGDIKATDNGFSENCSYYENIKNLKVLARQSGANLIKITKHKPADGWSTCDRIWVSIYKIDSVKKYETKIEWTPDRKLTWDDFKGEPNTKEFPDALAVTNSSLSYNSSSLSLFKSGKLFVQSTFHNYGSWVLPEGKTDYVLKHEQIHFDITEIYSRKLRKVLAEANVTNKNYLKANAIFEKIKNEWVMRQEAYDYETKHGLKKETQEEWEAIVLIELAKYDLYKLN